MAERIEDVKDPQIGSSYEVPHVLGSPFPIDRMFHNEEAIPVIGTWHNDNEHPIDFKPSHYHLDFRFISECLLRRFHEFLDGRFIKMPINAIVAAEQNIISRNVTIISVVMLREMPQWNGNQWFYNDLQAKYHGKCRKNGICPHKGNPTIGLDTCPAHGLRFIGDLVAPPNVRI